MLRRDLKNRYLTMATIEKLRARQRSRINYLNKLLKGKRCIFKKISFLVPMAEDRKISFLHTQQGIVHGHEEKEGVILDHFTSVLGANAARHETLNWESINMPRQDLSQLEVEFTEGEIKQVIMDMKQESAPGPDGFIGKFFRTCWDIIKEDLRAAIQYFYNIHGQHFNLLNSAHIVLLPKTTEAIKISEYRPISLTNNIAKIISKLLAN